MALPLVAPIVSVVVGGLKISAAVAAIMAALVFIQDWLGIFPDWLVNVFATLFSALVSMLKDVVLWVFEQVLDLIIYILDGFEFDFSVFNPAQYIGGMPADVVNVVGLIRVPEAVAIILAAIGIKVILQLIPFTRLGG